MRLCGGFFPLCAILKGTPLKNRANSPISVTLTAQWEKVKSVVLTFSGKFFLSRNFFQADERNFRDLRTTPRARGCAADRGGFPRGAPFRGTPFFTRLNSPFISRKSRRTRRLRFAVILRRQRCSGYALGIVFSFFGASLGLPLLKNAPNSFSFFPPPMRRKGKKSKARF